MVKIIDTNIIEILLIRGKVHRIQQNYEKAINCYIKILKIDPTDKRAPEFLIKTWSSMPNFNEYLTKIGIYYGNRKKIKEAQKYFFTSIIINPNHAFTWSNLGEIYVFQNKIEQAIICFWIVIWLEKNNFLAWANLAHCYHYHQRKQSHAKFCYKRALEINPKDKMTWNNLGILLDNQGNEKKSIACLVKAIQINPKDAGSWYNLGTIYAKYDRYQKAVILLKKGLECDSNNINLWTVLMYVYQIQRNFDEADKCFHKIEEIVTKRFSKR